MTNKVIVHIMPNFELDFYVPEGVELYIYDENCENEPLYRFDSKTPAKDIDDLIVSHGFSVFNDWLPTSNAPEDIKVKKFVQEKMKGEQFLKLVKDDD